MKYIVLLIFFINQLTAFCQTDYLKRKIFWDSNKTIKYERGLPEMVSPFFIPHQEVVGL